MGLSDPLPPGRVTSVEGGEVGPYTWGLYFTGGKKKNPLKEAAASLYPSDLLPTKRTKLDNPPGKGKEGR